MGNISNITDPIRVKVWNPDTLSYEVMTQPVVNTDELTVAVTFPESQTVDGAVSVSNFPSSQAVTGTFWQESQPVTGAFYPATQPVSGTVTVANPTNNPETGLATSAKQDTLLTELQAKADLTETQPTADTNFEMLLRLLINGIHHPYYYNSGANALQSLLITGSTTAVTGTLTAVTTVTGITNIGGIGADMMIQNLSAELWSTAVRSLLT